MQSKLGNLVIKAYILAILSNYNYFYEIYCTFKKEFSYFIDAKKDKNVKSTNITIYA